jgi:hypothetical protein
VKALVGWLLSCPVRNRRLANHVARRKRCCRLLPADRAAPLRMDRIPRRVT